MDTQSLNILEKMWSRVRKEKGTEICRLYPDGYLKLEEGPAVWIQLNPQDRLQLVRRLELYLFGKDDVEEIGDSIGELTHLTYLSIQWATSLKCLPNVITRLHNLQVLEIEECSLQELPASLGELRGLTHLSLKRCYNLQELPASLGELRGLTHLSLDSCDNLQELPTSLGDLQSLTHLTLRYCDAIKSIPNMKVDILDFESFESYQFPSFGKQSNLQTLILSVFNRITINLDDMPRLLFLDLQQSNIKHFSFLPNIKTLPKLQILSLPQHFRVETLPFDLNDSLIISVDDTHSRKTWKELKTEMMCSFSVSLAASGCSTYLDLPPCEYDAIEELESIAHLSELTHLYIRWKRFDGVDLNYLPSTITQLRHLSLEGPYDQSFGDCLHMLTNLESLDLHLGNILPIDFSVLVSLRCLTLRYGKIKSLPDSMAKLSNLKTLVLHYCFGLKSLPADMNLVKLKLIDTTIHPLPTGLRHLEILHSLPRGFFYCNNVNTDIKELVNLETLSITCHDTKFLPFLEEGLNLRELQLKDCFNLKKMPNLGKLNKLCTLDISGTRIKTLPECITNLHNLKHLILPKCFKLESLPHNYVNKGIVTIDDIHEEYYKRMGFYKSDYETFSEDDKDDNEITTITSDIMEVVDEEVTRISQDNHNTVQTSLHDQLQNLHGNRTPAFGEFGQASVNEWASTHSRFLNVCEAPQFSEDSIGGYSQHVPCSSQNQEMENVNSGNEGRRANMPYNENFILQQTETYSRYNLSTETAYQVEGHYSYGRNDEICEDIQHALHSLQNQPTKINNNDQSDDSKVTTQKKEITAEKIQSLLSLNMTIEEAANQLNVSKSTFKRRLQEHRIKWPKNNKKIHMDVKTTKTYVEPSSRKCSSQFNLLNPINPRDPNLVGVNQLAALPNNVPFESNDVNMDDNQQGQEIAIEPPHESSSTFIVVKATCNGHTGKINFCLTKSIDQLKQEVRNKLEVEDDNFFMEYEDEEQEWVIMNSISDLKHAALLHSKSSSGQNVRLRIIPKKSCYSTSMTMPMSQVIHDNFQSDTHLRGKVGSSSTRLNSTALYAPAINKMMTLDSFLYRNYLPAIMLPFLEGWLNVKADGNCGFRVVADAFHGGKDNWARARWSMCNELSSNTIYEKLYGGQQEVREAMNRIWWDNSVESVPPEHWMTSIQDLFVIATFYNCVVIYFSFGATPVFHTILPLRALPDIQRPHGELVIAHCETQLHYIRVFLLKDAPLPPIASYWHKICDQSVRGWDQIQNYAARLVFWEKTVNIGIHDDQI